jgi:general secretion pathway protein G
VRDSGMGTVTANAVLEANEPDGVPTRLTLRGNEQAGFTLLEILVVIVILGLLIGLVAPAALRQLGGAKISIAHQSIERLSSVLDLYRLDAGNYPSTQDGLQVLVTPPADATSWNGPYLKATGVPVDPWNHPFVYRAPSTRRGYDYDLCSMGPNAQTNDTAQEGWICN